MLADFLALAGGAHGVTHLGTEALDHIVDGYRGLPGALGEGAHLVGHHREAAALLPGTGGLNGGIQSQQVGLVGDVGNQLRGGADLVGGLTQAGHGLAHGSALSYQVFNGLQRLTTETAALAGALAGTGRTLRIAGDGVGDLLDGGGHFVHGRGGLFRFLALLLDGAGALGD